MTPEETLARQAEIILNSSGATPEERRIAQATLSRLAGGELADSVKAGADNAIRSHAQGIEDANSFVEGIGRRVEQFQSSVANSLRDRFRRDPEQVAQQRAVLAEGDARRRAQAAGFFDSLRGAEPEAQELASPERLAELEATATVQDPLAGGQPLPTEALVAAAPVTAPQAVPQAPVVAPAAVAPAAPINIPGPTAGDINAITAQIQASEAAAIQNAIDVDNLQRATTSANLVTTPEAQFTNDQVLQNLALQGQAVPTDLFQAVPALQQTLTPQVSIPSIRPAINAAAQQEIGVNRQTQSAEEDRQAALRQRRLLEMQRRRLTEIITAQLGQRRELNN